jgi:hypothetical protein
MNTTTLYRRIATMWRNHKTIEEIAKATGLLGKGADPTHEVRGILRTMHRGYRMDNGHFYRLPYRVSRSSVAHSRTVGTTHHALAA